MKGNNGVGDRIIAILKYNPEGLTIQEISEQIGMTRHSVTKYIYMLLGERKISQRDVGTAKLCYLCDSIAKKQH